MIIIILKNHQTSAWLAIIYEKPIRRLPAQFFESLSDRLSSSPSDMLYAIFVLCDIFAIWYLQKGRLHFDKTICSDDSKDNKKVNDAWLMTIIILTIVAIDLNNSDKWWDWGISLWLRLSSPGGLPREGTLVGRELLWHLSAEQLSLVLSKLSLAA